MPQDLTDTLAQLLQRAPQEQLSQINISPCLAPVGHHPRCLPPRDPIPTHLSPLFPAAAVPRCLWPRSAAGAASHTQHREHKGNQSPALRVYLPDKGAGHFCLLSADEWSCLGCEIGRQVPLQAWLLAGSWRLQALIATRAFWQGLAPHPVEKLPHGIPQVPSAPLQRQCWIYGARQPREASCSSSRACS